MTATIKGDGDYNFRRELPQPAKPESGKLHTTVQAKSHKKTYTVMLLMDFWINLALKSVCFGVDPLLRLFCCIAQWAWKKYKTELYNYFAFSWPIYSRPYSAVSTAIAPVEPKLTEQCSDKNSNLDFFEHSEATDHGKKVFKRTKF